MCSARSRPGDVLATDVYELCELLSKVRGNVKLTSSVTSPTVVSTRSTSRKPLW